MKTQEEIPVEAATEELSEKEIIYRQVVNGILDMLGLSDWLSYSKVIRQVAFFTFLIGLGIFHVFNSHRAERMVREISSLEQEIKELRWEQMSIKSDLMKRSMQSDIETAVAPQGLKSLKTPPYKIVIRKNEN